MAMADLKIETQEVEFCTLGMFIIDEIHFLPPTPPVFDVLGGAGTYSAIGARLFAPGPKESKKIGWIVDCGSDFPPHLRSLIDSWETSCLLRETPERLSTRGWNGYDEAQRRGFKYTTPKIRLDETALNNELLFAKSFHLICSPTRCQDLVKNIIHRRREIDPAAPKPLFIWEPVPDLCTPSELLNTTNTLPLIDICSPNHTELGALMGGTGLTDGGEVDKHFVEEACEQLLASMALVSFALVIRCGKEGCYIAQNGGKVKQRKARRSAKHGAHGLDANTDMMALFAAKFGVQEEEEEEHRVVESVERWIPAYHTDATKVVDPTGGGNGFLGGLAVALARGKTLEEASIWGSVSASFTIEQIGMPVIGKDENNQETWNGVRVEDRLKGLEERIKA